MCTTRQSQETAPGYGENGHPLSASMYQVFDRSKDDDNGTPGRSCGVFASLDEARGCVEFDGLEDYEIWQGDHIVEEREREPNGWSAVEGRCSDNYSPYQPTGLAARDACERCRRGLLCMKHG